MFTDENGVKKEPQWLCVREMPGGKLETSARCHILEAATSLTCSEMNHIDHPNTTFGTWQPSDVIEDACGDQQLHVDGNPAGAPLTAPSFVVGLSRIAHPTRKFGFRLQSTSQEHPSVCSLVLHLCLRSCSCTAVLAPA